MKRPQGEDILILQSFEPHEQAAQGNESIASILGGHQLRQSTTSKTRPMRRTNEAMSK